MERIEQAGGGAGAEVPPGLPIGEWEAQAALVLAAYRAKHDRQDINPADWEQNDLAVQNEAMEEWVRDSDDTNSPASRFRLYVERNPHKLINPSDDESLTEILAEI